ncbi:MAG: ABC transporter transmembrane domain-containing protein, partial [Candidatus Sumerlaeota bacterium]
MKNTAKKRSNLLRLFRYIKPYWAAYLITVTMGIIKFLVPIAVIWLFGEAINVFTDYQAEKLSDEEAWRALLNLAMIGIAIVGFSPIPTFLRSLIGAKTNARVIRDIRCDLYAHIQKLSHSFFDRHISGSLTSKVISDVETINPFLGRTVVQMWMNLGMIAAILGYLFWRNAYLGLLSISLIPIQLVILLTVGRKIRAIAGKIREKLAYLSGNTQEVLAAATVVKTFTQERDEIQRFNDDAEDLVTMGIKNALLGGISQSCTMMLNQSAALLVIIVGGWLAIFSPETLSVGLIVQFVMMQGQLYAPIERLSETQVVTA